MVAVQVRAVADSELSLWAHDAKQAFVILAQRSKIPINLEQITAADLATEGLHLLWLARSQGRTDAECALSGWVSARFLLPAVVWGSVDMLALSKEQYAPAVQPVEVMRMIFPEVEDGCTLHLYTPTAFSMSNGDCVGELHQSAAAYAGDEWAEALFRLMEAFYRLVALVSL